MTWRKRIRSVALKGSRPILHAAARYDLQIWFATRGRGRSFREKVPSLAHVERDQSVLDVGCGTGTLAIAARRQVERIFPHANFLNDVATAPGHESYRNLENFGSERGFILVAGRAVVCGGQVIEAFGWRKEVKL